MSEILFEIEQLEADNFNQMDDDVKQILRSFYSQLSNHPISFTIYGFFNINLNLLASILMSVTSFQIILVQFQTAS